MSETSSRRIWNPAIDENIVQEKQDRIISESDEKVPTSPTQVWMNYNLFSKTKLFRLLSHLCHYRFSLSGIYFRDFHPS